MVWSDEWTGKGLVGSASGLVWGNTLYAFAHQKRGKYEQPEYGRKEGKKEEHINLLATDFLFQILALPVFKMWVIQKPNNVALWNKRHFEGEKMEIIQHV